MRDHFVNYNGLNSEFSSYENSRDENTVVEELRNVESEIANLAASLFEIRKRLEGLYKQRQKLCSKLPVLSDGSLVDRAVEFLNTFPEQPWSTPDVAAGIGVGARSGIATYLHRAVQRGRIRLVARGLFQALEESGADSNA